VGLGDESAHWFIASLAYEYHIAPAVLMQESPRMLWTLHRYAVAANQRKNPTD